MSWTTLHIFGYGETQLIGEKNKKTWTASLPKAQDLITEIYSKKPEGSDASVDFHAINIFNNMFVDYQPNTGKGFRIEFQELTQQKLTDLITEIEALP